MNALEYLAYNLGILGEFYAELFEGVVPGGSLRLVFFIVAGLLPAAAQFRPARLDILRDTLLCTALSTVAFVMVLWFETGPLPFLFLYVLGVFGVCLPISAASVLIMRLLRPRHPRPARKAKPGAAPAHHH
jgi:hypothetical protein